MKLEPSNKMISDNFTLQDITVQDIESIYNIYSNTELLKFTDSKVLNSKQDTIKNIKFFEKGNKNKTHFYKGISDKKTNNIIGIISLYDINKKHKFASIFVIILPEFQKKGIMTNAINRVIKIAFEELNLNRIEAQIFEHNISSIALFQKLNFKYEGKLRQNFLINGKFENSVVYSKIRSDNKY